MNLTEYKNNAIVYIDLVHSEILDYKKKAEEANQKVLDGKYTRVYYNEKISSFREQATNKLQALYDKLISAREDVLNAELEQLQAVLNKPAQLDNFAEIEMLKMLDYRKSENVEIYRRYSKKYIGNKLVEAVLKQIEADVYKEHNVFLMGETSTDLEQKLKDLVSRIDSKVVQFHVIDYDNYLTVLEMYISGAKGTINRDYDDYISKKAENGK